MKKLLSCLIVLSMMLSLCSFVPAVSAEESTGVNDHIARVGLGEGTKGGFICIDIYNTKTENKHW